MLVRTTNELGNIVLIPFDQIKRMEAVCEHTTRIYYVDDEQIIATEEIDGLEEKYLRAAERYGAIMKGRS